MSDEHDALVNLARGLVEEITAVKAAELARQLSRDPGTLALAAPAAASPPVPSRSDPSPVWHPTLTDPAHRTHLLGHPGNSSHLISGQARPGQSQQPVPPPPARRRGRRRAR